jgi:hypothetical protein
LVDLNKVIITGSGGMIGQAIPFGIKLICGLDKVSI